MPMQPTSFSWQRMPGRKFAAIPCPLSDPLYFLYCHAAESAFKAFLTAHYVPMSEITGREIGHNLPKLYERSRDLGLVPLTKPSGA
jgi:hypothetical protein